MNLSPDPASLVESLRAFPYSPQTAIADLVDNSVTAQATRVEIVFEWDDRNPVVEIRDNGTGMTRPSMLDALRFGGIGPNAIRNPDDLGRFGLGLKTASLSQCRRMTVSTCASGSIHDLGWDIDELSNPRNKRQWVPTHSSAAVLRTHRELLTPGSGTIVRWEKLDRLLGNSEPNDRESDFNAVLERVEAHLAMVFHRFLMAQSPSTEPRLTILCNGRAIEGWDPFLSDREDVWTVEELWIEGENGNARVQSFVLPHQRDFEAAGDDGTEWRAAGRGRWNELQGFFVYRGDRLLSAGGYLDLGFQREEHQKLARIVVDLPNTADSEWSLDVTKSSITPPHRARHVLSAVARLARSEAQRRYRAKVAGGAKRRSSQPLAVVWQTPNLDAGTGKYRINKRHGLIDHLRKSLPAELRAEFDAVLDLIARTVPLRHMSLAQIEDADRYAKPYAGDNKPDLAELTLLASGLTTMLRARGWSDERIINHILGIEPFNEHAEIVDAVVRTSTDGYTSRTAETE